MRARELDQTEREAMISVLERIEEAGTAVASELSADIRVERPSRGRFPAIVFRAYGSRPENSPVETGEDMPHN
jgi:hypothetical protein